MASKKNEVQVEFNANTSQFNKAIKEANSTLTTLRSELKLNKAQMDSAGDSVENLANRQRILEQEADASSQKINALTQKLEAAKSTFGENSVEAQRLATQLNNARIAQEIGQTAQALDEERAAASQAESAMGKMEATIKKQESALSSLKDEYSNIVLEQGQTSQSAQELAGRISKLSRELDDNKAAYNEARTAADKLEKELDQVGDAAREASDDLDLMDAASGALSAGGIAAGIAGLAGIEESTRQYRNEQSKLEAVAKQSGASLDDLTKAYNDIYSITGDSTLASTAVLNMSAMGTSVEDQERIVTAAAGAWAQFGDSIPLDGLMESINESSRLGTTLTGPVVDALNWANISTQQWSASIAAHPKAQAAFNKAVNDGMSVEDAFNEALKTCGSTQERQKLLTDALSGAYGDLGEEYRKTNESVIDANEATANMEAAMGKLGDAVEPTTTWFKNLAADGLSWFVDNLPTLTPLITALGVAIGGLTTVAAVQSGFFGLSNVLKPLTGAFTGLSAPVLIIVGIFAVLAAGLMTLWNNSEEFRTAVMGLVDAVGAFLQPIMQAISDFITTTVVPAFQALVDNLAQYITPLIQQFTDFLTTIVFPALQQFAEWFTIHIVPALQQVWDWFQTYILPVLAQFAAFVVSNVLPVIAQIAQWIMEQAVPALLDLWDWFQAKILPILQDFFNFVQTNVLPVLADIANFIVTKVVPAVMDMFGWFQDNILPVLQDVWGFIQDNVLPILGQLAEFIVGTVVQSLQDLWNFFSNNILPILEDVWNAVQNGIDMFNDFKDTVGEVIDGAKKTVDDGLKAISNFFSGLKLELPKIKLPHFSITGSFSLNPPSIPRIGVEWYAKGGIFDEPTIFPTAKGFKGVGEAGPEAVTPIDALMGMIDTVIERRINSDGVSDIIDAIEGLSERVISLEIDGYKVAKAIAGPSDRVNGNRQRLVSRGLSL